MRRYRNLSGRSGVVAFEVSAKANIVRFVNGDEYVYTDAVTGEAHVEAMKVLADAGQGLATYISQHVQGRYAEKRERRD